MATNAGFGYLDYDYCNPENAQIAIIPVPYDQTSTWVKGADEGPDAIIEASGNMELYDIGTDSEVYQRGILTDEPVERDLFPVDMVETVKLRVQKHLDRDRFPVIIGGEHSVSIGAIQACAGNYDDLTVLQLDAHADLREQYDGSKYNHACVMARAKELCSIAQVGIRSMSAEENEVADRDRMFFAKDIHDNSKWIPKAVSQLSDQVYVTIDLDVFDISIMPSTGTPEPGGLGWYQVLSFLKTVFTERDVVGFDVVELCPNSKNKAPNFLAAKLIYKLLTYKFEG